MPSGDVARRASFPLRPRPGSSRSPVAGGVRPRADAGAARAARRPAARFPAIHVVGTNGKSTATRTIADAAPRRGAARRRVHLAARERLERADPGRRRARPTSRSALERVRAGGERLGATQFEVLTAAALAEFAARGVDVAVVEAGLGGRLDATNVARRAGRPAHERRARAHRGARRDARGDRAREARRRRAAARPSCSASPSGLREPRRRAGDAVVARRRRARPPRRSSASPSTASVEVSPARAASSARGERRLGRRAQPGGGRLAAGAAARGATTSLVRLDPRRQGRRGDARRARACGKHPRRDAARRAPARSPAEELAAPRRAVLRARRGRRRPGGALERAQRARRRRPCSSPARSTCSPTSSVRQQRRTMGKLGERLSVFAFAASSSCGDRRPRVRRRVPGREAAALEVSADGAQKTALRRRSRLLHSGTWFVIRNLAIFFVVVFWLAIAFWVFKDARRRIEDPWLVGDGDRARRSSRRSSAR